MMKRRLAAAALYFAITGADQIRAQPKASDPAQDASPFEVVSIKPADPGGRGGFIRFLPGGRFEATGVPVKLLIQVAYDLQSFQIVGLPAWTGSDRFVVEAKATDVV